LVAGIARGGVIAGGRILLRDCERSGMSYNSDQYGLL
jgi:hypothetical protein